MNDSMRVLVTGATGFLGGWIAETLVHSGYSVRALVRRVDRLGRLEHLGIPLAQGDILSEASLHKAMAGVNAVVHCAASVSLRPRDRAHLHRANVAGTKNVLTAASARGIRVVHTSSIATVGPTREALPLDENAPGIRLDFDYPYAQSKREAEDLALAFARNGCNVVVLNPGIMLGPGDVNYSSTEFILRYLRSELGVHLGGGGSFCDVRDVAQSYVAALERGRSGERYILAGVNRAYGDVLEELRCLTGLQKSTLLPGRFAEWGALCSELGGAFWQHPFEKFNSSVVRWGSLFNFCRVTKAENELGYRIRDFSTTLVDTVVDHLRRGSARAATPRLRALLKQAKAASAGTAASEHL